MNDDELLSAGAKFLRTKDLVEAEKCFREVLARNPKRPDALVALGVTLFRADRLDEAEAPLLAAEAEAGGYAEAQHHLGLIHLERDEIERALHLFESAISSSPLTGKYILGAAAAYVRSGDFARAGRLYVQAAALSQKWAVSQMLKFDRPFFDQIIASSVQGVTPEIMRGSPGRSARRVILVSCDESYFRKYAPTFLSALAQNAPHDWLFHLHALDPRPSFAHAAATLIERTGVERYVISGERSPAGLDAIAKKAWYTCSRFANVPAWLRHYEAPVMVVDVDAVFDGPMDPIFASAAAADLGLQLRRPRTDPWLEIPANCLVANPTEGSGRYFSAVAAYVGHFVDSGNVRWGLDQCALYCTLRMAQEYGKPPSVRWINDEVDPIHYHVGGAYDDRMRAGRYAKYTPPAYGNC